MERDETQEARRSREARNRMARQAVRRNLAAESGQGEGQEGGACADAADEGGGSRR